MSNRALAFADTETTGFDPAVLIELGYFIPDSMMTEVKVIRAKNPIPIEIEAMATHHITPTALQHLPFFKDNPEYRDTKLKLEASTFVAHNAPFDIGVLEREDIRITDSIDTQRVARHLLPELTSVSLQYLRYYFELYLPQENIVPHTAIGDVRVLMAVFEKLKRVTEETYPTENTLDKMRELTNTPVLLTKITFGKYAGKTFQEINRDDRNYITYLFKQNMVDRGPDFLYTVEHWMNIKSV